MKIISIGFWLLLFILGVVFAVLNTESVQLNYYFARLELPVSLVISMAMLLGACLGGLASLGAVVRARRAMSKLKKQAEMTEKEVLNLRAIPIRDKH